MAITGQTIVTQAWVDLGVGSPGQTMPANQAANGLAKLNMVIDEFSAARDLIYEIADQLFLLTSAQSFAIGPTAPSPFNTPVRPNKIENAQILITVGGKFLSFDLEIVSQAGWQTIDDKGATATVPSKLYFDPQVPNAFISVWPIPLCVATTTLDIGVWNPVGQFATLATSANLPPAYNNLLNKKLQLELMPTYGRLVSAEIQALRQNQYQEALSVVRSLNAAVQMTPLQSSATPTAQQLAVQAPR